MNFLDMTQEGIGSLDSETICNTDSDIFIVFQVAVWIIRVLQFAIPFALIIWGSLDFFKAVIAGDEKEMKAKRKPFLHIVIAAVIVLTLPTLVSMVISSFKNTNEFASCWDTAKKGTIDFRKYDTE